MDEELDYVSSSSLLAPKVEVKPQDEIDLPTLKKIQIILQKQIDSYDSISRLSMEEKDLTLRQQLAVNDSIKQHLTQVKALVDTTIDDIKEKYSDEQ